jgi:hypothetical protein
MTIIAKITLISESGSAFAHLRKEFKTSLVPTVGAYILDPGLTDADGLVTQRMITEVLLDLDHNIYEITIEDYQLTLSDGALKDRANDMKADSWELVA